MCASLVASLRLPDRQCGQRLCYQLALYQAAGATLVSNELTSPHGRFVAAAGVTPSGKVQVHTLALSTAQLSQPSMLQSVQLLCKDGSPIQISNLFLAAGSAGSAGSTQSGGQSSFVPLIGLSADDGSVFLTKAGEIVWQREEALAEVSSALFVDLPADAQTAEKVDATHEPTSIMDHIQSQFLSLKVALPHQNCTCFILRSPV